MFKHLVGLLFLLSFAFPASAIECLESANSTQPILVLGEVTTSIQGIDSSEIERALRERLVGGGKYRVLLPDQYQYAVKNRQIDRCSSAFIATVKIDMRNTDAGAAFGFSGFVTRSDFVATVQVLMLPDRVTLDDFAINDKANTFIAGTAANKAFQRLLESLAVAFESRRETWVRTKTPGLDTPSFP
jgi:hypothetical protein